MHRLGEKPLDLAPQGISSLQALYNDIETLMTEILESNTMASLESLKSHNDYTFQHSVDVAVLGILLGRTAGLPREQLRELALGCLLHDLGKMYIDEAILDKPGKLTTEEFDEIKKHPQMGFELIRRMPVFSILPAHVAFQHHERQDGGGYPRGLIGTNMVVRSLAERMNPKRILLIAEIAAVADVYSALTSDRPYRTAMPLDKVTQIIREMSGPHLNSDVVTLLLRTIPMFPVGHWVEVQTGQVQGLARRRLGALAIGDASADRPPDAGRSRRPRRNASRGRPAPARRREDRWACARRGPVRAWGRRLTSPRRVCP